MFCIALIIIDLCNTDIYFSDFEGGFNDMILMVSIGER